MKKLFLFATVTMFISGCGQSIKLDKAENIQDLAAMLHGHELYVTDVRGDSEDPVYGYKAFRRHIESVKNLCTKDGGELQGKFHRRTYTTPQQQEMNRALASGNMAASDLLNNPSIFVCKKSDAELWRLQIDYKNIRRSGYISMFGGHYIYFTPYVRVLTSK